MTEYYVHDESGGSVDGPLDLLAVSIRIRRQKILPTTLLSTSPYDAASTAGSFAELQEMFADRSAEGQPDERPPDSTQEPLGFILKDAFNAFAEHQSLAVITGLFLIIAVIGVIVVSLIPVAVVAAILGAAWVQAVFAVYAAVMLRKSYNHRLDDDYVRAEIARDVPRLGLLALVIGIGPFTVPAILAAGAGPSFWLLAIMPGALIYAYFAFAPMLMADRNMGVAATLKANAKLMTKIGLPGYTMVLCLVLINVLIPIPPVTMPITYLALCAIYERQATTLD